MKNNILLLVFILLLSCTVFPAIAQKGKLADKPLYRDPVFDGAADPVVIWNKKKKRWWMFYTSRRATIMDPAGVEWVHGTRIGIAESKDGSKWHFLDTASINYHPDSAYTFWAPAVVESKGIYHMYLTYVPGIFNNWDHPRQIVHLTSKDLINWKYESVLPLANNKVIDASVTQLPDGSWRMWYNNERDGKSIWYANSPDLYQWEDKGKAIAARGEGPVVFRWKDRNWMLVDVWKGLEVYHSEDLLNWTKQSSRLLEEGGHGKDDEAMGGHCDVLVNGDKAYIFYFTHPGRTRLAPAAANTVAAKRSVIQVVELQYRDGNLWCDRNQPVYINLKSK